MATTDPLHTLETWNAASPEERDEVGRSLARQTGFELGDPVGPRAFRTLNHPSGLTLVAIPGGVFWSGLSDTDLHVLFTHLGGAEVAEARWAEIRGEVARATPELVRVAPFLIAAEQWGDGGPTDLGDEPWSHPLEEIEEVLGQYSGRVPTGPEWEWVAREGGATPWIGVPPEELPKPPGEIPDIEWGGPNGFGVAGLHVSDAGELVVTGQERDLRGGHGMWQDDIEAIALLSGYRWGFREEPAAPFRLAFSLDLPAPEADLPRPLAPDDEIGRLITRLRQR